MEVQPDIIMNDGEDQEEQFDSIVEEGGVDPYQEQIQAKIKDQLSRDKDIKYFQQNILHMQKKPFLQHLFYEILFQSQQKLFYTLDFVEIKVNCHTQQRLCRKKFQNNEYYSSFSQ